MRYSLSLFSLLVAIALLFSMSGGVVTASSGIPANVDISQRAGNESEEAIAVNPTNPKNIVMISNVQEGIAGLFKSASFDGGKTWTGQIIANFDNLGDGCCDPSLSFDEFGNLFFTYLYNVELQVPVALITSCSHDTDDTGHERCRGGRYVARRASSSRTRRTTRSTAASGDSVSFLPGV